MSGGDDNNNNNNNSLIICTICCEKYIQNDNIFACECGHVFHYDCLQKWLDESANCPICRINNPNYYKLFLDFELTPRISIQQARSTATCRAAAAATTTPTTFAAASASLAGCQEGMSEYENLLYEVGVYRDEIDYLNQRLANKERQLASESLKNTQLEQKLSQVRRNVSTANTFDIYESFGGDLLRTIVKLDEEDDDD